MNEDEYIPDSLSLFVDFFKDAICCDLLPAVCFPKSQSSNIKGVKKYGTEENKRTTVQRVAK